MCELGQNFVQGRRDMMITKISPLEVFRVETDTELSVGLTPVNKAVHPLRRFSLTNLGDDTLLLHGLQLILNVRFHGQRYAANRMDDWWHSVVKSDVILAWKLADAVKTLWIKLLQLVGVRNFPRNIMNIQSRWISVDSDNAKIIQRR